MSRFDEGSVKGLTSDYFGTLEILIWMNVTWRNSKVDSDQQQYEVSPCPHYLCDHPGALFLPLIHPCLGSNRLERGSRDEEIGQINEMGEARV